MISKEVLKIQCVAENIITQKCFPAKKKGSSVAKKKLGIFSLRCQQMSLQKIKTESKTFEIAIYV